MTIRHPYRYPEAFRRQLDRLEKLAGITLAGTSAKPEHLFFAIEITGVTRKELARRNRRLHHLEGLIADWRVDGETTYHAHANDAGQGAVIVEFPDVPGAVSYIEFEASPLLELATLRGSRIEGVYMREIAWGGKSSVELTFVCEEPGWRTMDRCIFADAIEVGSRISVGIIPLGWVIGPRDAMKKFLKTGATCPPLLVRYVRFGPTAEDRPLPHWADTGRIAPTAVIGC